MKAITIYQPWDSLIAFGLKTIETRGHARFLCLAGQTIAIHAGLKMWQGWPNGQYPPEVRHLRQLPRDGGYEQLDEATIHAKNHLGCVVAIVDVTAHRQLTEADSAAALCPAEGLYGLILGNVRRFKEPIATPPTIPATSHRGIWTWEPPAGWEELLI